MLVALYHSFVTDCKILLVMAIPFICCYHPETDQVIEDRNLDAFTPFIIRAKGENVLLCMTSSLYSKILSAPPERNGLCYYYFFIWFSVVDADTISKAAILGNTGDCTWSPCDSSHDLSSSLSAT